MRVVWLSLSLAGLVLGSMATAQADCQCVAGGKKYQIGEVICLSLPGGSRLARCGMVLNNSSWTQLQETCPIGFDGMSKPAAGTQVATAADHAHDGDDHIHTGATSLDQ
jgi:hypothetical protein